MTLDQWFTNSEVHLIGAARGQQVMWNDRKNNLETVSKNS